jgi:periplasmic protein TonB
LSAAETLIRVSVVSRDAALVEEVHNDLMVGFSTRGGYDFEGAHPDFQQFCDVLFVDLRPAGLQSHSHSPAQVSEAPRGPGETQDLLDFAVETPGSATDAAPARSATGEETPRDGVQEGLAFIDSIRASVSHPPIVVLCDADAAGFRREVMRCGAYDTLTAPLNTPQLRLTLQRAYEFRLAETKLESFLTEQVVAKEGSQKARSRKVGPAAPPVQAIAAPRPLRRVRPHSAPSRLAVGFVLGCVIFFGGLVAVRTILTGMGDALASAGFAADPGAGSPEANTLAPASQPGAFPARHIGPLTAPADFSQGAKDPNVPGRFRDEGELAARPHSSLPGYEPATLIERVTPRYSQEARNSHLQGKVQIRALIGVDGVPRGISRLSGDPMLAQIAIDAIALWRYAPATLDGQPVESEVVIPIEFQLPD